MTPAWQPVCRCRCGDTLSPDWRCTACGAAYAGPDGLVRWLDADRRRDLEPFFAQYRLVRQLDGYRSVAPEYYRRLPVVTPDDPQASVWRVRAISFARICALLEPKRAQGRVRVLDLGAGSGWLSARLADQGWVPVAVDLFDDDRDGLGASAHFPQSFLRVIADFDDLPFAPRQFDAVIFNGSLHYAPRITATVTAVARLLADDGLLLVADSPAFERASDGERMRARVRRRFQRQYGLAVPIEPGEGYFTFARIEELATQLHKRVRYFESAGPGQARPIWSRLRRLASATPPSFGVWVAQ